MKMCAQLDNLYTKLTSQPQFEKKITQPIWIFFEQNFHVKHRIE